jgi:hypothetical protein
VAVGFLVLGTSPVLDVVALALLALHDPMDAARRTILTVIVEVMPKFPFLTLAVTLVDVATGVAITLIFVKVGA